MLSILDAKAQDKDEIEKIITNLSKQELSRRALAQKASEEITAFTNNLDAQKIQEVLRDEFTKNSGLDDIVKAIMRADHKACPSMTFSEDVLVMDPAFIFRNTNERLLARNGMRLKNLGIKGIAKQLALCDGSVTIFEPKRPENPKSSRIAIDTGTIAVMSLADVTKYNSDIPAKRPYAHVFKYDEAYEVRFSTMKSEDDDTEIVKFEIETSDGVVLVGHEI